MVQQHARVAAEGTLAREQFEQDDTQRIHVGAAVSVMALAAGYDPHRNHLDHLRFSRQTWDRFFNHSVKHQNRLRYPQFVERFQQAGFETVWTDKLVDWESIPHLRKRGVAAEFRHFGWEDLATIGVQVVVQKPITANDDHTVELNHSLSAS